MTNNKNHENYAITAVYAHDGDAPNSSGLPDEEYGHSHLSCAHARCQDQSRDDRWDYRDAPYYAAEVVMCASAALPFHNGATTILRHA